MAELQQQLKEVTTERDQLLKEKLANQQLEPAAPALELPDKYTLKSRLKAKLPLFRTVKKGKKEVYEEITAEDAQTILDLLEG